MRILLVNQFFFPDSAATSLLLTDVARELSREHEVEVLCAQSSYLSDDTSDPPQARVRRLPAFPFGRSKVGRILSYASYIVGAAARGLVSKRYDIVLTLTTPPLVSLVGTLLKRIHGARHYSWEMDLYPDIVCDLGFFKETNILIRAIGTVADYSRREADGVIALGDCMRRRLIARKIPEAKIHVAENWADSKLIEERPFLNDGKLKMLYSGNLGLGHDIYTICNAMNELKSDVRFQFTFAGGGARRGAVKDFCTRHSVQNVTFPSYSSRKNLSHSLGDSDIGLVTQQANCSGSIVPSKLYGILAAGRPVVYVGPRDSTPAQTIVRFRCGWIVDCGDSQALSALLLRLAENREEVHEAGRNARKAFLESFDYSAGTARICALLLQSEPQLRSTEPADPSGPAPFEGSISLNDAYLKSREKREGGSLM